MKSTDFPFKTILNITSKLCTHKEEGDRQKERSDVWYESLMSREGRWREEEPEEGGGGGGGRGSLWRREPQVRGHQPRSSELITPSISLSDPGRKEGGRMEEEEVGGSSWPRDGHREKKADY